MRVLVFDVGGTLLRGALWDCEDSILVRRAECASPGLNQDKLEDPVREVVEALASLGRELIEAEERPDAIGVAFPGPVDRAGCVSQAPTLWGQRELEPVDLGQLVSSALWQLPTQVVNDLTAAGFRYASPGDDFCIVTVSSGIGNKVFLNGQPELGRFHRGGEFGHWRVDQSEQAPMCECGGRGHLGALASGRSVPHHWRYIAGTRAELLAASTLVDTDPTEPEANLQLAEAFRAGDSFARAVVEACAAPMGVALAGLHLSIGLERFVIVGGWAQALGPDYLRLLESSAAANAWGDPELWKRRIEAGEFDDDSGLIGMGRMLAASNR